MRRIRFVALTMVAVCSIGICFLSGAEARNSIPDDQLTAPVKIIRVPGNYPTIQAGIDAAVNGDVVEVAEGIYKGKGNKDLDFRGKLITVRSASGPNLTIIDCEGDGRGFDFHSGETKDSKLEGFTITNGYGTYGGGIYCEQSSPAITNCIIKNNEAYVYGGGIYLLNSSPTITNCTIEGNRTETGRDGNGGGINISDSSSATIVNCVIKNNEAGKGGGLYLDDSSTTTISDSTVKDNKADDGGGLYLLNISYATITNSTIEGNIAERSGGGLALSYYSSVTITNSIIEGNTAKDGAGINLGGQGNITIVNCVIKDNEASGIGGGFALWNSYYVSIRYSTITGNKAEFGAGFHLGDVIYPSITNCILWGDSPDEIFVSEGMFPSVTYSDVKGGWQGPGNINVDPLFAADGYHLTIDSPVKDRGKDVGVYTDIDGESRPQGQGFDMGADERARFDVGKVTLR